MHLNGCMSWGMTSVPAVWRDRASLLKTIGALPRFRLRFALARQVRGRISRNRWNPLRAHSGSQPSDSRCCRLSIRIAELNLLWFLLPPKLNGSGSEAMPSANWYAVEWKLSVQSHGLG